MCQVLKLACHSSRVPFPLNISGSLDLRFFCQVATIIIGVDYFRTAIVSTQELIVPIQKAIRVLRFLLAFLLVVFVLYIYYSPTLILLRNLLVQLIRVRKALLGLKVLGYSRERQIIHAILGYVYIKRSAKTSRGFQVSAILALLVSPIQTLGKN